MLVTKFYYFVNRLKFIFTEKEVMKLFVTILIFVSSIHAQVNIEKYNSADQELGLIGNLSFYISAKTGNTDVQEFGIDGRLNYNQEAFKSFLIAQGEYGWNKGKEYSNNALLHFRVIKTTEGIIQPEFYSQINYNRKQLLLFRALAGLGVRFDILKTLESNLNFGTSYMYENEKLDLTSDMIHPNLTNNHRWSNYLSYSNSLTENSRLSIIVYAQPKFDDFKDTRILNDNHISVGFNEKLALSLNFSLRYDSKPPDGVKDLDTNTKVGLTIKL